MSRVLKERFASTHFNLHLPVQQQLEDNHLRVISWDRAILRHRKPLKLTLVILFSVVYVVKWPTSLPMASTKRRRRSRRRSGIPSSLAPWAVSATL
jgi:hypothetical protein